MVQYGHLCHSEKGIWYCHLPHSLSVDWRYVIAAESDQSSREIIHCIWSFWYVFVVKNASSLERYVQTMTENMILTWRSNKSWFVERWTDIFRDILLHCKWLNTWDSLVLIQSKLRWNSMKIFLLNRVYQRIDKISQMHTRLIRASRVQKRIKKRSIGCIESIQILKCRTTN